MYLYNVMKTCMGMGYVPLPLQCSLDISKGMRCVPSQCLRKHRFGEGFLYSSKARECYALGGILYSSKARKGYAWGGIFVLEQSKGVLCLGRYFVLVGWQECCEGAAFWCLLSSCFWCLSYHCVDVGKRDGKKLEIETANLFRSKLQSDQG